MNLFLFFRDCISRALERKKTLAVFVCIYVFATILGILFIKTPAMYHYHLNLCDRFVERVCYSDRNVFLIFWERACGNSVFLAVILSAGIHPIGCIISPILLLYRAYTFGGSLVIFFTVYRVSGILIVFVLYLPIHLLIDAILLCSASLSCGRASCFCFSKDDFVALLRDFLVLLLLICAVCLLEMILLLLLFHPIGNLL